MSKKIGGATAVIVALLTSTRQARLNSFRWTKPYLEHLPKERRDCELGINLLEGYAVPVAETSGQDETERQEWLVDYLSRRGFLELLSSMVIHTGDLEDIREPKKVPNPYGKERILPTLISYTSSSNQFAAETAISELRDLCWFDAPSAAFILVGLQKQNEMLKAVSYPANPNDPKPMLLQRMKDSIRSAQRAVEYYAKEEAKAKTGMPGSPVPPTPESSQGVPGTSMIGKSQ